MKFMKTQIRSEMDIIVMHLKVHLSTVIVKHLEVQ